MVDRNGRDRAVTRAEIPSGIWYGLALLFGLIPALEAFLQWSMSPGLLVQDDARQFLFWMQRWSDPDLFPGDVIVDYFQSATPLGFAGLYRTLSIIGLDFTLANRLLPILLGLILAHYAFGLTLILAKRPGAAFLGSALTSFFIWLVNPVASGTPRAFAVPILLAFLFYLAKRRILGVLAAAFLSGLFYPHIALIIGGLLATCLLEIRQRGRLRLFLDGPSRSISLFGLLAVAGGLAPFALRMGGDALSRATAMSLPSMHPGGRSSFFVDRVDWFLLCNERSGFLPVEWGCHSLYGLGSNLAPVLAAGLLALALVPSIGLLRYAAAGGLRERERFASTIPVRVIFVSVVGFVAAHFMLFDLHLPSRFGQYPLRAITFVALVAWVVSILGQRVTLSRPRRRWLTPVLALLAALALVPFPFVPRPEYVEITRPGLHAALAKLPKDTAIAALGDEADNIPSAAARSVFVSREYLIPWSEAFGTEMRRRMNGLVEAVYSTDRDRLRAFGEAEGIGAFVLAAEAFSQSYLNGLWWKVDFPEAHKMALERVQSDSDFVLGKISEDCPGVRRVDGFTIIPAPCWR